jgi:hypothetical protein
MNNKRKMKKKIKNKTRTENKEKILKPVKGKEQITYKGK